MKILVIRFGCWFGSRLSVSLLGEMVANFPNAIPLSSLSFCADCVCLLPRKPYWKKQQKWERRKKKKKKMKNKRWYALIMDMPWAEAFEKSSAKNERKTTNNNQHERTGGRGGRCTTVSKEATNEQFTGELRNL